MTSQFQINEHTSLLFYLKEVLFSSTQHILNNKSLHTLNFQFSYLNIPFFNPTVNKQHFLACIQLLFVLMKIIHPPDGLFSSTQHILNKKSLHILSSF